MRNRLKDGWQEDIKKLLPKPTKSFDPSADLGSYDYEQQPGESLEVYFERLTERNKFIFKAYKALG